jgi:hypothetical protein
MHGHLPGARTFLCGGAFRLLPPDSQPNTTPVRIFNGDSQEWIEG